MQLQILILDDDAGIRNDLCEFFSENYGTVFAAGSPSQAFSIMEQQEIDIVILDLKLPEMNGLQFLQRLKADFSNIEVIMITGHGDTRSVVEAMKMGAFDFFTKPFRLLDIQAAIERTNKFLELQQRLKKVELDYAIALEEFHKKFHHPLVGKSQAMKKVLELMNKVAQSDATSVLITGESGTGKELVARGIHELSCRKSKCFCEVNCSAIPESLLEKELFGHNKGAFTGAIQNQAGYFEIANHGTLFLDEIGDMPISYQNKLLRTIEDRKIKRLGSSKEIQIDIRIISATNQDLKNLIAEKRFRLDLFHRINTFVIHLLPLRERPDDIPVLLEYYTTFFSKQLRKKIAGIDEDAVRYLMNYSFPGNIRELKNLVERAVIVCDGQCLSLHDLNFTDDEGCIVDETKPTCQLDCPVRPPCKAQSHSLVKLDELVKDTVMQALQITQNNKSEAAKLLGISRQSLDRRMEKYHIQKKNL